MDQPISIPLSSRTTHFFEKISNLREHAQRSPDALQSHDLEKQDEKQVPYFFIDGKEFKQTLKTSDV